MRRFFPDASRSNPEILEDPLLRVIDPFLWLLEYLHVV